MSSFVTQAELNIEGFINPLNEIIKQQKEFGKVVAESAKASKESFQGGAQAAQQFNNELKKGTSEYAAASAKRQQLLQAEVRSLIELQVASKKAHSVEDVQKYAAQIEQTKQRIALLQAQEGKGLGIIGELIKRERELTAARDRSNNPVAIQRFNDKLAETKAQLSTLTGGAQKTEGVFSTIANTLGKLGIALGAFEIFNRVVGWFSDASRSAKDFEVALDDLQAVTNVTDAEMVQLRDSAEQIGQRLKVAAADIVEGFKLVGSANPELLKNREALAGVTQDAIILARAAKITLPEAVTALTGTLAQFSQGADQARATINALAAGSVAGAAEIKDINASFQQFGVVAASANVSVSESVALVELLAEKQIKAGEAGTGLRNVLIKMSSIKALPKEALDALQMFGVNIDLVSNKSVPLNERLKEFSKISNDATALTKVFGAENLVAGQIILSNVGKFEALNAEISKQSKVVGENGIALQQAKTNVDNYAGAQNELKAVVQQYSLLIGEKLNKALFAGTKFLTQFLLALKEAPAFIRDNRDVIAALVIALVSFNAANIAAAASTLYYTAVEKSRAIATRASAVAQGLLNAVMSANPIGLVVAAVALLTVGFKKLYENSETVRAGIAGLASVAKEVFKIVGESVTAFVSGFEKLKSGDIKGGLKSFGEALTKSNPVGIALSEGGRLAKAFNRGFNDKLAAEKAQKVVDIITRTKVGTTTTSTGANNPPVTPTESAEEKAKREAAEKKAVDARKKLEEDLQKDLLDLQKKYDAARLSLLDKDSVEYLDLQRTLQRQEIDDLQKHLEAKAKLLGKGELTPEQIEQLNTLRRLAEKQHLDGIINLNEDHAQRLFDLEEDSYAKELEAVRRRYDKLEKAARGDADELKKIAQAKNRDLARLEVEQANRGIQGQETNDIAAVQNQIRPNGLVRKISNWPNSKESCKFKRTPLRHNYSTCWL